MLPSATSVSELGIQDFSIFNYSFAILHVILHDCKLYILCTLKACIHSIKTKLLAMTSNYKGTHDTIQVDSTVALLLTGPGKM